MYTWVYTAEVLAKRVRERYLQAVLRQDVAYFETVGAGEVATRIQTDTRESTAYLLRPMIDIASYRPCAGRDIGEGRSCANVRIFLHNRHDLGVHQVVEVGSRPQPDHDTLHRNDWGLHE